ncbi:hypothetical protein CYMTET_37513 [Cymbomonas tetramitiformis]|uniref:Uncharacterized protein n=1 Tax=Cymbomonas tetramitiformis TaxID=36881 RepID=A0AAE0F7H1_9CHLO|nr:hypothetical protein CYMTET_37513 [Cymbomonas tetramitiformis]
MSPVLFSTFVNSPSFPRFAVRLKKNVHFACPFRSCLAPLTAAQKLRPRRSLQVVPCTMQKKPPKDAIEPEGEAGEQSEYSRWTDGKSWATVFEAGLPGSKEEVDEVLQQLNPLNKLLALLVVETALPLALAISLSSFFSSQTLSYASLKTSDFAFGISTVLPLLALDAALWLAFSPSSSPSEQSGQFANDLSDEEAEERLEKLIDKLALEASNDPVPMKEALASKRYELAIFFESSLSSLKEYPSYVQEQVTIFAMGVPKYAFIPTVSLAAATEELLWRGVYLGTWTAFLGKGFQEWADTSVTVATIVASLPASLTQPLAWDAGTASMSASQFLALTDPPPVFIGWLAVGLSALAQAVSLLTRGREDGPRVEITFEVPVDTLYPDEETKEEGAEEGEGSDGERSSEDSDLRGISNISDQEGLKQLLGELDGADRITPDDVDALRELAVSVVLSIQLITTGNVFVPMLSRVLSQALMGCYLDLELKEDPSISPRVE